MLGRIRARYAWALCVLALTASGALVVILGSAGGAAGAQKQQLVTDSAKLAATSPPIIKPPNCELRRDRGSHRPRGESAVPDGDHVVDGHAAGDGNPEYCDVTRE